VTIRGVKLPDLCPFHQISGLWCPGCGLTRSFISMGHGDFAGALQFNPLGPVLYGILIVQILIGIAHLFRKHADALPSPQPLIDFSKEALLTAFLLLGIGRIAWGLTHPHSTAVDEVPPSNLTILAALVLTSAALVGIFRQIKATAAHWPSGAPVAVVSVATSSRGLKLPTPAPRSPHSRRLCGDEQPSAFFVPKAMASKIGSSRIRPEFGPLARCRGHKYAEMRRGAKGVRARLKIRISEGTFRVRH
jgi:Protein of unknown function (DUF2752)